MRPATYTIKVEAPGFRNVVRTRLVLAVSQQATVDFALSLASTKVKKIALVDAKVMAGIATTAV